MGAKYQPLKQLIDITAPSQRQRRALARQHLKTRSSISRAAQTSLRRAPLLQRASRRAVASL